MRKGYFRILIDKSQQRYLIQLRTGELDLTEITTNMSCQIMPNTGKMAGFRLSTFREELKRARKIANKTRSKERRDKRFV